MKSKLLLLAVVVAVFLITAVPAFAHVHGITPCTVGPDAGANATNGTPADDANGGPISGLIPRDTGNAPLTVGDGGDSAPVPECEE